MMSNSAEGIIKPLDIETQEKIRTYKKKFGLSYAHLFRIALVKFIDSEMYNTQNANAFLDFPLRDESEPFFNEKNPKFLKPIKE